MRCLWQRRFSTPAIQMTLLSTIETISMLFYSFDESEHPLVGQLGGNDPEHIAEASVILEKRGYDEINLNCGCPSNLVSVGHFIQYQLVAF